MPSGRSPALPAWLPPAARTGSRYRTSPIARVAYSSDASHYQLTPQAVLVAADATEVGQVLAALDPTLPATLRSGGTSLSGQASGDGLLIDVRRQFRQIEVLDGGRRVRAQAGATVRQVNARLARHGYRLGPDPASEAACTIGGVVANNSSGMTCGTSENTYRTLESMVMVLPSGTVVDTARPDVEDHLARTEPALAAGLIALRDRVRANPDSLQRIHRQFALKNTMGYGLNSFVDFDTPAALLAHLVIGSEGTLAFIAEATFRAVAIQPSIATALAIFPSLTSAAATVEALATSGAATVELMDSASLRVGQRLAQPPEAILGLDVSEQAALLVEYQAPSAEDLALQVGGGAAILSEATGTQVSFDTDPGRRRRAWAFRKGLYASVAGARTPGTTALLEDIAVPVAALAQTCLALQDLFGRYGYEDPVIFGHAKDGNLHFMLVDRLGEESATRRYLDFTDDLVDLVLDLGGNLKAEHGTGRAMAPYVERQFGSELYQVMWALKRLCDPRGVMNPGVILALDPDAHTRHLKVPAPVEAEVDRCVECGYCEPVCPSKDLTLTPRQRIVVRRAQAAAQGRGEDAMVAALGRQSRYASVDTCAVDGMCATVCPLGINTGDLVKRLRAEQVGPLTQAGWLAAAHAWGPVTAAAAVALDVAAALPAPVVTAVTDVGRAVLGQDAVPRYTGDLPGGGRRRSRHAGVVGGAGEPRAIYLPACVGTMFGPADDGDASDAFIALAGRAGVAVLVPQQIDALCCGTPWSSKGMSQGYAVMRGEVVAAVTELAQARDLPVVVDASSCTEGFAKLLGETVRVEDALVFAERELLPRLSVPEPVARLVLHPTCSSVQNGSDAALTAVAAVAAREVVVPQAWGCCGFAGDRGMLHPELTASATAAEAAEVATVAAQPGATEFASCNRTCELGMTRATGQTYRHVLEVLAEVAQAR